jgi:hypothetical protein
MRGQSADLVEIMEALDAQTPTIHGRAPTRFPLFARTFGLNIDHGHGPKPDRLPCPSCALRNIYNQTIGKCT